MCMSNSFFLHFSEDFQLLQLIQKQQCDTLETDSAKKPNLIPFTCNNEDLTQCGNVIIEKKVGITPTINFKKTTEAQDYVSLENIQKIPTLVFLWLRICPMCNIRKSFKV